jgi:hypothetical protein
MFDRGIKFGNQPFFLTWGLKFVKEEKVNIFSVLKSLSTHCLPSKIYG